MDLIRILLCSAAAFLTLILPGALSAQGAARLVGLENQTSVQLEHRLEVIKNRLNGLAHYSIRSGVGAIGFRSKVHREAEHLEWFKIEFDKEQMINEIMLVPALLRDTTSGFRAEGFPVEMRIVIGEEETDEGIVVASFTAEDKIDARIAPLVVSFRETKASWLKVEATKLSSRKFDGRFLFQIAEILAFSNRENVALGQRCITSSNHGKGVFAWGAKFAVDGHLPYLMNTLGGEASLAYVGRFDIDETASLMINLGAIHDVSQINLHSVDQGHLVPQMYPGNYANSKHLRIEGACQRNFEDAKILDEFRSLSIYETGPINFRRFEKTECQFIRLTAADPFEDSTDGLPTGRIGFAEIEIIEDGKNVALGKRFRANFATGPARRISALTDGSNYFGRIIGLNPWLWQLAERYDLEAELPLVQAELSHRYQRQRSYLVWLIWLAVLLSTLAVTAMLVGQSMRRRAITMTREQIAADLHDELGANVHAIGILSDLAQSNLESPLKLQSIMQRIRELTQRTGTAAGYCSNLLESEGLFGDLSQDMKRSSARLTSDLEHELSFEGLEHIRKLELNERIGLLLFYKEGVTNVIKHSRAAQLKTHLKADEQEVYLSICDNGIGLPHSNVVPASLARRAKLLGAQVSVSQSERGGTLVALRLALKRSWAKKLFTRREV